jgi:hypothetical protein
MEQRKVGQDMLIRQRSQFQSPIDIVEQAPGPVRFGKKTDTCFSELHRGRRRPHLHRPDLYPHLIAAKVDVSPIVGR